MIGQIKICNKIKRQNWSETTMRKEDVLNDLNKRKNSQKTFKQQVLESLGYVSDEGQASGNTHNATETKNLGSTEPKVNKPSQTVSDYVPGAYSMTKSEYNRRRAVNPDMPEFGSYEYFKNQEKALRPLMDEIADDDERRDDAKLTWSQNYKYEKATPENKAEGERLENKFKYQDEIIAEYINIDAQLKKFEVDGVHYDEDGNIDTKSGSAEAKYAGERYDTIASATALSNTEFALGFKGELPADKQAKYDQGKKNADLVKVEYVKEKAYEDYDKNKDKVYENDFGGRVTGGYKLGDINISKNNASYASYVAGVDDLEASDVYNALSERIQKNNYATFQNNTKSQELLSAISQYLPQARDQLTYEVLGRVVGIATGTYGLGNFVGATGSAEYMYRQTAGASFERLLRENNLSVEDAKKLASSEALASSVVEFGLSAATGMLWKTTNFATKGAIKNVVSESTEKITKRAVSGLMAIGISEKGANIIVKSAITAGKIAIDGAGEGFEEWIQEGMSIKADRYAKEGKTPSAFELFVNAFDLSEYSSEDFSRMNQSFLIGAIIGFGQGGFRASLTTATNGTMSKIANAVDTKALGKEIIKSGNTDVVENAINMVKGTASSKESKAIERIETAIANGKTPSAKDVGAVVKSALTKDSVILTETQTGQTAKVVSRDGRTTVLEVTDQNGNVGTRTYYNKYLDRAIAQGYIAVTNTNSTPSETIVSENETVPAETVVAETETTPVETTAVAENATTTTETTPTNEETKTISLTRMGDFYEMYGDDALALAENLDMETTRKVVNGVETDVLEIPVGFAEDWANAMAEDGYTVNFSDKPSIMPKNESVVEETETTDETTSSEEKTDTVDKMTVVVNAIEDTLTENAKADLANGEVKENYARIAKTLIDVYGAKGSLEDFAGFFTDGGKTVESAIGDLLSETTTESLKETNVSEPKVLKNESESDMIESTTENTSEEREENDDARGSNSLSRDGRRESDGSTRKQNRKLFGFERKNQGKDAKERYSIARELINRGQVEKTTIGDHTFNKIKAEAYTDDMLAMVEEARKKGVELVLFVGKGTSVYTKADGTKVNVPFKGLKLNSKQVFAQYDHRVSPQKIAKHETIHAKWFSDEFHGVKDTILGSLTEEEKQNILAQPRYADYMELHNSEEIALEEFVCDVMAGMNDYTSDYIDTVNDYWYGDESVDSYNVAEYSESIDAGGNARYSLFPGGVFPSYNKSQSDANERATRWAHNDDIETGAQRIFFYKNVPYLVEKFDSMDLGYLVMKKLTKKSLARYERNMIEYEERDNDGGNNGSQSGRKDSVSVHEQNQGLRESGRRSSNDNNNSDRHNGEIAEVQGVDRKQDGERTTQDHGSRDNKRGVEDREKVIHSLKDSTGRKLSKAQQEYFKDSKVRDENGNLLVVYHGTRNKDFTVFKRNHNYYTDNRDMAESYAPNSAIYEGYLNITNPYIIDAEGSKWSAIPISDEVKKMLDDAGSSTFKEKGKWCTSVADIVSAISDMVDEGSADYDGVIVRNVDDTGSYYKGSSKNIGNDYITFKSEQFKNTDNTNPTNNPDIRYDISEEQDAEYMKAVESGDMETAQRMVDEAAEKAFPNSKVRESQGDLKDVYHGRVSNFNVYDRHFANIEGDFGKGYYFTSNEYDVDANYANEEGPDLKNKIAKYAEQLEWNDEYSDLSYGEREEIARQKFVTSEPNIVRAFLNMENPVYITPDEKGTLLDYTEEYDEEYDEYGEPEGLLIDFVEALNNIASDYAYNDVDFNFLYEYAYDNGGVYASDAVGIIKRRITDELTDEDGNIATNEVIRLAFEEIGFDGIIDTSVYYKFRNMSGMDSGTTHYIAFNSNQIKSAEPVTYDDDGNVIPLSKRFNKDNNDIRYDLGNGNELKTQKKIEKMAKEITSHEELIELTKQNTQEFVDKVKENKNLQKRLNNAKRQMLVNPKPVVNVTMAGKVTKDILTEMESTLKAKDLQDDVVSIYNEHAQAIKKSGGVKSKVEEANDTMVRRFTELAVDIADNAETFVESEMYALLKAYVKETRIKVPDHAKEEADFSEFRKSHMGTFNLTNDGLDIDIAYAELCDMFPGLFDSEVSSPADQLNAIADKLNDLKPYAYNPHSGYMNEAIDHIVNRFVSEADGITAAPKTKAQKMAEKSKADKEEALYKEKESWARKMDREKAKSEKNIQALQKKIDDAKYVQYWEKRLGKEEKAEAVQKVRDAQKKATLKSQIRNIVADMKKHLDKTEKNGGYPKELVQVAAEVGSAIDFHTGRTNKDGTPTKVSLKLDALRNQYDTLKNSPNYDFQTEYSAEISDKLLKLRQDISEKRVVDLTLDELSRLKDILSEIHHGLSIASKQIGKDNAKANYDIFTEIVNDLEQIDVTNWKHAMLKGESWVINPNRIFEMVANYNKESAFWKLYEGILRGERGRKKFTMDANMPFDELTSGGANEIAFYDFRTKNYKTGIKYTDGTEVEIPKSIICELVMLWERKDGKKHLASGGMKIPDMERFNKGQTRDAMDRGKLTRPITQADITRLRGMLDSYDKAWINRAYHLFNKVGKDAINETSMQLVGRAIAKAKNYIRAYVDSDFVRQDIDNKNDNITLEGHGSLKETDPNAQNPVVLRGLHENVYDHIDFVAKYSNLAIPIRNFNKVYKLSDVGANGHRSIKSMLAKKFGSSIRNDVIVKTINELQYPRPKEISGFDKIKGRWLLSTFWGNLKSMFKQTTSYWTASSILDESSLLAGLKNYVGHSKQTKDEIAKYSGTLYGRSQGLSTTELGDRANRKRLAGASSNVTKAVNKYAPWLRKIPEGIRPENWLQSMDVNTSAALWEACKHQVSKTMNKSDDGYMKAVTDLYERIIEETQSNYDVLHRPEVLKTTNEVVKTLAMFQNDNLQQTGILKSSYGNLKAKQKAYKSNSSDTNKQALDEAIKRMNKAIRARVYSSFWLATVSLLGDTLLRKFKPYIDDEEKEITSQSVLKQMMLNMADDMLGVFLPVVGSFGSDVVDTFVNGYDLTNIPAFDVLEDFIKATSKIWNAATKDKDGDVLKAFVDAVPAISNMTGVPIKNITDMVKSIKGYIGDIKVGKFAHDLEDYTTGNKSFYSHGDLASCISSGDSEKEQKILGYYSANEKEISKGSLTKEIKPAYVQMYVDSPEKASELKRKLVLEYDYSGDSIDKWMVDEYLKHIVSDPEYAVEIKNAVQHNANIDYATVYKTIKSYYEGVYKDGDEAEIKALRSALSKDAWITEDYISQWELEADAETEKARLKQEAEKEKYR